ncbi:MAG: GDP-mannose 4,6-dehydratase [Nitrososphaeria archaeon]
MKILVIGSKGFIGSHCVEYFSARHEVWQCDIVVDYTTPRYLLIDPTDANYHDIFSQNAYDVCINCSGAASVPDSLRNPQRDFYLNTYTVFRQLDALRLCAPNCKYIHISSAAVYGNPVYLPIDEKHPLNPLSPYGIHKKVAEEIVREFCMHFSVKACSLRVFSAYGPRLKKQLFWDLYQKQRTSVEIFLYGTGKETRDFIYITDLVEAMECVIHNASFCGESINVANGKEYTVEYVARTFYRILGKKRIKVNFTKQERKGDPSQWRADIIRLKQLGYYPRISIEEGIENYIRWLKGQE